MSKTAINALTRRRLLGWFSLAPLSAAAWALPTERFEFLTQHNQWLDLEAQLGQGDWLLIEFWGSFCGICDQHQPEIVALQKRYHNKGLSVIGVAVDGRQSRQHVNAFIKRHNVEHPVLMDNGHGAARFYAAMMGERWLGATPTYLLFRPNGELVGQNYGVMHIDALLSFIDEHGGLPS